MAWIRKPRSTGLLDVTALSPVVTSGRLTLSRDGETSWLMASNLVLDEGVSGSRVDLLPSGTLPPGMIPPQSVWQDMLTSGGAVRRLAVSTTGWVPIYGSPRPGDVYHFTFGFPTPGQWPTTLPGVKL